MNPDIRKALRKITPVLLKAQEDNLNEADTVQRLVMFFEQVLGYDRLEEITREHQVKDKYVDVALKIDGGVRILVEAKAAATELRDRHIEQAKSYGAESNIRWVLLTNGVAWSLYHLTFDDGLDYERVFAVDLSKDEMETAAESLSLLHRQSVRRDCHEQFWQRKAALDAESIARALYTDTTLRVIRRQIRKREGISVDEEDLASAIHALFSTEAREKIGPVKIRRRRAARKEKLAVVPVPVKAQTSPAPVLAAQKG